MGRVEIESHFNAAGSLRNDLLLVTGEQNTVEGSQSRWSGLGLFHGDNKALSKIICRQQQSNKVLSAPEQVGLARF